MRPAVLVVSCAGASLAVVAFTAFAPSGLSRLDRLRDESQALTAEVQQQKADNGRLADETLLLQGDSKTSKALLEKAAREELSVVSPGEIVITGVPATPLPEPVAVEAAP
jgi:cell division protein FtsB